MERAGLWRFQKIEGWVPKDAANPSAVGANGCSPLLVVWRKLTDDIEQDNLMLDEWFRKNRYVNGSNSLPNLKLDDESGKVRLIKEEFMKKMWEAQ